MFKYNQHHVPVPFSAQEEHEYNRLGSEREVTSFSKSSAASNGVDPAALTDSEFQSAYALLGAADANFDRVALEARQIGATAGSGGLLRADQQDLRRPLHGQAAPYISQPGARTGANYNIWRKDGDE